MLFYSYLTYSSDNNANFARRATCVMDSLIRRVDAIKRSEKDPLIATALNGLSIELHIKCKAISGMLPVLSHAGVIEQLRRFREAAKEHLAYIRRGSEFTRSDRLKFYAAFEHFTAQSGASYALDFMQADARFAWAFACAREIASRVSDADRDLWLAKDHTAVIYAMACMIYNLPAHTLHGYVGSFWIVD